MAGYEWAAIKDAISGGGPNLKRYETYLKEVSRHAIQYPLFRQELTEWAEYMKEFWEHLKTVKINNPPTGGNKPIFKKGLWEPEF